MKLDTRVCGIPCIVRVTHYECVPGSGSRWSAASDLDYYGWEECEYDILDRRGRPAPWLERKMTDAERERIDMEIAQAYRDEDDCAAADWAEQRAYNRIW